MGREGGDFVNKEQRNQALALLYVQASLRHRKEISPDSVAHLYTEGLREIGACFAKTDEIDDEIERQTGARFSPSGEQQ